MLRKTKVALTEAEKTMARVAAANEKVAKEVAKRKRTVRVFPAAPFEEPLAFAKQMFEYGSGEPVRRLSFFDHIGKSPDSGPSRMLVTNASKYGLIKGNYAAELLEMTEDGVRSVDPQMAPRDQLRARIKLAIEDIEVFAKLHERFVGKALPAKTALIDTAVEFGATKDAAEEAVDTFVLNLKFVGLLVTLSGAERVVSKDAALDAFSRHQARRSGRPRSQYRRARLSRPTKRGSNPRASTSRRLAGRIATNGSTLTCSWGRLLNLPWHRSD